MKDTLLPSETLQISRYFSVMNSVIAVLTLAATRQSRLLHKRAATAGIPTCSEANMGVTNGLSSFIARQLSVVENPYTSTRTTVAKMAAHNGKVVVCRCLERNIKDISNGQILQ